MPVVGGGKRAADRHLVDEKVNFTGVLERVLFFHARTQLVVAIVNHNEEGIPQTVKAKVVSFVSIV